MSPNLIDGQIAPGVSCICGRMGVEGKIMLRDVQCYGKCSASDDIFVVVWQIGGGEANELKKQCVCVNTEKKQVEQ